MVQRLMSQIDFKPPKSKSGLASRCCRSNKDKFELPFQKKSEHRAGAMEFNAKRRDSDLIPLFRFQNQAALMIIEMLIDLFRMKAKIVR
jgi:hypothetical protein